MAAAAVAAPVPASSVGDDPAQGSDQPPPDAVVQEAPEVEAGLDRIYEEGLQRHLESCANHSTCSQCHVAAGRL